MTTTITIQIASRYSRLYIMFFAWFEEKKKRFLFFHRCFQQQQRNENM